MIVVLNGARFLVVAALVGFVGALLAARLLTPKPAAPEPGALAGVPAESSAPSGFGDSRVDGSADLRRPEDRVDGERRAEIEARVRAWARAWSEQRVEEYFDFYSVGFEPADAGALSAWRELRELRINRPGWIRVTLGPVDVRILSPESAVASFAQSYETATYRDRVRKRLRLVLEDGVWMIEEELAEPL